VRAEIRADNRQTVEALRRRTHSSSFTHLFYTHTRARARAQTYVRFIYLYMCIYYTYYALIWLCRFIRLRNCGEQWYARLLLRTM